MAIDTSMYGRIRSFDPSQVMDSFNQAQRSRILEDQHRREQEQERQMQEQLATRKNVLAQYLTPAQSAQYDVEPSNALAILLNPQSPAPVVERGNMVDGWKSQPQQSAADILPTMRETRAATPATFDRQGAIAALQGAGDLEGAEKLAGMDYKDSLIDYKEGLLANASTAGAKAYGNFWVPDPENPGKVHPAQYTRGGGVTVDRSISVPEQVQWLNTGSSFMPGSKTGGTVPGIAPIPITMTPGQAAQNDPKRQGEIAKEKAIGAESGKQAVEREAGISSANTDIDRQLSMIQQMEEIAKDGGFYGNTMFDKGKYQWIETTGTGSAEDKKYQNTKQLALIAKRLLLEAKPKGSGNPTEGEWRMFGQTIADPSQYPDVQSYLNAVQTYKAVLEGSRPIPSQFKQGSGSSAGQNNQGMGRGGKGTPRSIDGVVAWLQNQNIGNSQEKARKAVQELQRQKWTREEIEAALDRAGL